MPDKQDLRVQIPEKFRKQLDKRFDPSQAVLNKKAGEWIIAVPCSLCLEYNSFCGGCPFERFGYVGCEHWIRCVLDNNRIFRLSPHYGIFWHGEDDAKAREQIMKLREAAEKLIEWV
ncbi:hypothetical protein KKD19_03160 [Patescibacteria group bacterium]|nr:hypothetical protein [Patescibacteria group bacterium]MBU4512215.1 hypothetical protein [Patescibacteria group bacterium]MCG2692633.1 hypothetical protein [Candidatus Parcubacteria bacterium]